MIQCRACGQANSQTSNFCRYCGARFGQPAKQTDYDTAPPRPYVWKTDEFQAGRNQARKTINQVQPLGGQNPLQNPLESEPFKTRQLAYQPPVMMSHGYRCPRCANQAAPKIEKRISNAGWIVFAIFLVAFFPLFWIGFLIKEEVRVCPVCNLRVG